MLLMMKLVLPVAVVVMMAVITICSSAQFTGVVRFIPISPRMIIDTRLAIYA